MRILGARSLSAGQRGRLPRGARQSGGDPPNPQRCDEQGRMVRPIGHSSRRASTTYPKPSHPASPTDTPAAGPIPIAPEPAGHSKTFLTRRPLPIEPGRCAVLATTWEVRRTGGVPRRFFNGDQQGPRAYQETNQCPLHAHRTSLLNLTDIVRRKSVWPRSKRQQGNRDPPQGSGLRGRKP